MNNRGEQSNVGIVRRLISLLAILCMLSITLCATTPAQAHPADMYFHAHEVTLTPEGLVVHSTVQPGPMLSLSEWYEADSDQNGVVTSDESVAWAATRLQEFECMVGETGVLSWTLLSVEWPSSMEALELGDEAIRIEMQVEWPLLARNEETAKHRLTLHFQHAEPISVNWYYLHGESGVAFDTPKQSNGRLQVDFNTTADTSLASSNLTYWDSGSPTLGSSIGTKQLTQGANPADPRQSTAILTDLIRTRQVSPGFYLGAFVITLALGSIHALTPGHGKTLVAAYLIGSRGTVGHAAGLGSIVTLTHTGSVLIFGFIALVASHFLVPTDLFPYLEMLSGLLIVVMGAGLIWPRWQGYRRVVRSRRRRRRQSVQDTESQASSGGSSQPVQRVVINQAIDSRPYDSLMPGNNLAPASTDKGIWYSLLTLGISGGLVPCPDAIAILLIAVAINRILLGLGLVVTFSVGMAIVLILIGMAVVRGRLLVSRVDVFSRISPILPLVSAVVVLGVGVIMTVNVMLKNDLFAPWKTDPVQAASSGYGEAGFDIEKAGIIYLAHDAQEIMQIYSQAILDGQPRQLSNEQMGVRDYEVSPNREFVSYTVASQDINGIWIVPVRGGKASQAVDCLEAYCTNVTWSPDGTQLIYERMDLDSTIAIPTLWSYTLKGGETRPVFQDEQMPGYSAKWSPDGHWLSYLSYPGTPMIELYNLQTGQGVSIPSETGQIAVWSSDSTSILLTKMQSAEDSYISHLYRYELKTKQLTGLTSTPTMEDISASWSPDGEWLAVVRRDSAVVGQYGTQIWLMRPDGSDAHPVTTETNVMHSTLVWSSDGRYLLVQQIRLSSEARYPEVWLLDLVSGAYERLLEEGYRPSWML
ncbi:MAG: PD40 domain-containing protein [Anaerolineae bacterium]|nr:PD40 domain-containing protein [Anaerolineae bacterium]